MSNRKLLVFLSVVIVIVGSGLFAVGWYGRGSSSLKLEDERKLHLFNKMIEDAFKQDGARDDMDQVDGNQIQQFLKDFASIPHLGGTQEDEDLAKTLKMLWSELGLDQVEIEGYEMLLDFPDVDNPNLVKILNGSQVIFQSQYRETTLQEGDDHPSFVDSFLAYSPAGSAEGDVVYVNYGSKTDFELIANMSSPYYTNVTSRICLVRDGKIFRGNKAENSFHFGCSAMVLFSDPADVAPRGTDPDQVYPHTFFLPETGMQRGSLLLSDGDPETPNYPSIGGVERVAVDDLRKTLLPKIPCQPIGYSDAKKIFQFLDGENVPDEWKGKIEGVRYTLGGKFHSECVDCKLVISTHNKLERRLSSNVIGILKGGIEPDRYVIVGNHRDAWGFGAADPSSGTAQMTEVIRILGQKVKMENWRPRRTIIFASWASEEYGLTGSREFVEEFVSKLSHRAVVYLNVDICTGGGDILEASATPTIQHKVIETSKNIPGIRDPSIPYYDFWKNWTQVYEKMDPSVGLPGAGSDHASFIFFAGVPVIDFSFGVDLLQYPELAGNGYPSYHTAYETLYYIESLLDPDVTIRETCSKMNLRMIRDFSDSLMLDYKPEAYVDLMEASMVSFALQGTFDVLSSLNISISSLESSISEFRREVMEWRKRLDTLDVSGNPMIARYVNDQVMKLDRVFLLPQGLPNRPMYRHAIISPSVYNTYSAGSFPGLTDLINGIEELSDADKDLRVHQLKQHITDLTVSVHQAANYLKEVAII